MAEEFLSFKDFSSKYPTVLAFDGEVEVKEGNEVFRGKFPYSAFGHTSFTLVVNGKVHEFPKGEVQLKFIKNPVKETHYSMRGGRKSRRQHKKSHRQHKKSRRQHKKSRRHN